jgi:hypothetical protein
MVPSWASCTGCTPPCSVGPKVTRADAIGLARPGRYRLAQLSCEQAIEEVNRLPRGSLYIPS